MYIYIVAHIYIYIDIYVYIYIHTDIHANTYMHTYIHTYIYVYIYSLFLYHTVNSYHYCYMGIGLYPEPIFFRAPYDNFHI